MNIGPANIAPLPKSLHNRELKKFQALVDKDSIFIIPALRNSK